jgi:hypothetical protein
VKSKLLNEFLNKYKELEKAIRDNLYPNGANASVGPVAQYESELKDSEKATKLRYLRNLRNTVTHNPDLEDFVAVTVENIKFIDELIVSVESINGIVKDKYKTLAKAGVLPTTSTIKQACEQFSKKKVNLLIVHDEKTDTLFYLPQEVIIKEIAAGSTLAAKLGKLSGLGIVDIVVDISEPLNRLSERHRPIGVTRSGKIVGILE